MLFLLMYKNLQTFQLMLNLNSVLCHCWEGPCINHPHVLCTRTLSTRQAWSP